MSRDQEPIPLPRAVSRKATLPDIKPRSPVASLDRRRWSEDTQTFPLDDVAPVVGMSRQFIRRVLGTAASEISAAGVVALLDQDAFGETFVPRSQVLDYLVRHRQASLAPKSAHHLQTDSPTVIQGEVTAALARVRPGTVRCVVTSTPYWALRIYKDSQEVAWADGATSVYGHEQTPDGFIRHTVQILHEIKPLLTADGSVWWNIMDSYNTRTQIWVNAAEALRRCVAKINAGGTTMMLVDTVQGMPIWRMENSAAVPSRIAERASRLGYHVKSIVTWAKEHHLPEPQNSRVSRALEYVLHLAPTRTPKFDKTAYRRLPPTLGGRNPLVETDKLSDVWRLPTAAAKMATARSFHLLCLPAASR